MSIPSYIKPLPQTKAYWDAEVNRPYAIRADGRGSPFRRYLYVQKCASCGREFLAWESKPRYCCAECKRTGITGRPYVKIKVRSDYANKEHYYWGRWLNDPVRGRRVIFEQQEIAEKLLGRELRKNECVHHINMDTLDNRHSNLLVCDRSYHMWLHQEYGRRFASLLSPTRLYHVRVTCSHCGETLHYQAVEAPITGGEQWVRVEVDPCEECLATIMLANQDIHGDH